MSRKPVLCVSLLQISRRWYPSLTHSTKAGEWILLVRCYVEHWRQKGKHWGEHAVFTPHFTGGEPEVPQPLHLLSSLQQMELTFPKPKIIYMRKGPNRTFHAWQELCKCDTWDIKLIKNHKCCWMRCGKQSSRPWERWSSALVHSGRSKTPLFMLM